MSCFKWANKKIKNMDWIDIASIKLAVAAFILMIASFWPVLIELPWYWYAIVFVLAAIRPWTKMFGK